ncbi:MAG: hypothetical protein IJ445_06095, partial [Clostridia bacterium]|nr:hypothetical protein [Clostridia bacterium]
MKKRFLPLFLAACLAVSSLQTIAFADSADVNGTPLTLSENDVDWAGTNGTPVTVGSDCECISFEQAEGYKYQFSYKAGSTLAAGDYKLSVTARFDPAAYAENDYGSYIDGTKASNTRGCLVDNGLVVGVNAGTHGTTNNILTAGADTSVLTVTAFNKDGAASDNSYALGIDDEWHTFEIDFTLKADQSLEHFGAIVFFYNIRSDFTIPVQVKDLSLVNSTTEETYSQGMDAKYWTYRKGNGYDYDVTIAEETPYFTTLATGADTIMYVGDDTAEYAAGIYTLNTNVRGAAGTVITAGVNGVTASYTLTTDTWEAATFELDTTSAFTMSDITIGFGADIDFTEIELVNTYIYPVCKDFAGTNGEAITAIGDDKCVSFEQAEGYKYQFSYKAGSTLAAGDYKLTVTARFDPDAYAENDYGSYIDGTKASNTRGCLVDNGLVVGVNAGTHGTTNNILTASADTSVLTVTAFNKDGVASDNSYALGIDDEWHTFEIDFTLKADQSLEHYGAIVFFYNIRSDFTIPVQVKDLSLVNSTTEEIYSQGMDAKYWTYRKGNGYDYDVTIAEEIPYFTTTNSGAEAITYIGDDTTEYGAGGYTVNATVRGEIGTVITAGVNGVTASYTIETDTWETAVFTFDTKKAFTMSDITIGFNADIDFTEIE